MMKKVVIASSTTVDLCSLEMVVWIYASWPRNQDRLAWIYRLDQLGSSVSRDSFGARVHPA